MVVLFPTPATTPLPFSFQAEWNCLFPFNSKLNGIVISLFIQGRFGYNVGPKKCQPATRAGLIQAGSSGG